MASTLARENWPASSTKRVSTLSGELFSGPQPRGAGHDVQLAMFELGDELARSPATQQTGGEIARRRQVSVRCARFGHASAACLTTSIEEVSDHGM